MDENTAEFQYVQGQMRESFGDLLADFEERNARAIALPNWELDQAYGPHPREVLDMRTADADALGTVIYFHAGYWQSRDKSQFRFLAPSFNALGWHTALINYPLCPDSSVAGIVTSAAKALRYVATQQIERGRLGPIVLCGHSAGAHLAIELALEHAKGICRSPLPIAGVAAISGVFDLQPLAHTSLNKRLNLDLASALASSPSQRVCPGAAPALFIVGETETPAFHAQSQDMVQLWQEQGNTANCTTVVNADHFSVLESIATKDHQISKTMTSWIQV